MKHLEKFSESVNVEDIKDILLELEDMDMTISFETINPDSHGPGSNDLRYYQVTGYIGSPSMSETKDNLLSFSEIKDCLLRLKDYLGDSFIGFWYSYWYPFRIKDYNSWNNSGFSLMKLSEDLNIDTPVRAFMIRYKDPGIKLEKFNWFKKKPEPIKNTDFQEIDNQLKDICLDINDISLELMNSNTFSAKAGTSVILSYYIYPIRISENWDKKSARYFFCMSEELFYTIRRMVDYMKINGYPNFRISKSWLDDMYPTSGSDIVNYEYEEYKKKYRGSIDWKLKNIRIDWTDEDKLIIHK